MLKKILLAMAVALPMFASAQSTVKIGVVDTNVLIQAMPEATAAQTKLADTSKKYEDAYATLPTSRTRSSSSSSRLRKTSASSSRNSWLLSCRR